MTPTSHQVVVMSSSVDIQFVARLVADLCAQGLDALDTSRAEFDHPERTVAYPHTGVLLIVLSADGLRSAWLEREIGHALNLRASHPALTIIPVILTAGLEPPIALEHLAALDFAGREYDDALADLLARVAPDDATNGAGQAVSSANGTHPAGAEAPATAELETAPRSGPLSWQQLEEMKRARHDGGERQATVATPPARVESDLHAVLAETEYMLWGSDDDADAEPEPVAPE
ncbi:MAG TPA: toll/interleukin-1 receptor domain-containing protein, partial [Ktedonobacterales bacterium]|nr:toll/interleukin-1 receptor domain-containing protein [Ktedonobacterales bacterium]